MRHLRRVVIKHGRRARNFLVCAGVTLAATAGIAGATAPVASAGYYWGCTYSWGNVCYGPNEPLDYGLITMDQNWAHELISRNPENGYPHPSGGHPERQVCGGTWSPVENRQNSGWDCAWGYTVYNPAVIGEGMIGGGNEGSISAYQEYNLYEP